MKVGTLRRRFKSLHYRGWTWERIGNLFGHTRGWAHKIAYYPIPVTDEVLKKADRILPKLLWEGTDELDELVLNILERNHPITGRELAKLCGTVDRTIRSSIKRLREKGYYIDASMRPPRGYQLKGE